MDVHGWVKEWKNSPTTDTVAEFMMWLVSRIDRLTDTNGTADSFGFILTQCDADCKLFSKNTARWCDSWAANEHATPMQKEASTCGPNGLQEFLASLLIGMGEDLDKWKYIFGTAGWKWPDLEEAQEIAEVNCV